MDGMMMLRVERAVYYSALEILTNSDTPRDMWPIVIDSAAGRLKDDALTALAIVSEEKPEQAAKEEDSNGEHPARD